MRIYHDGYAETKFWFTCQYCNYEWTWMSDRRLKKAFMRVYYLMLLKIGVRKRQEKEKARFIALCALSQLSPDICEKIICQAYLL